MYDSEIRDRGVFTPDRRASVFVGLSTQKCGLVKGDVVIGQRSGRVWKPKTGSLPSSDTWKPFSRSSEALMNDK